MASCRPERFGQLGRAPGHLAAQAPGPERRQQRHQQERQHDECDDHRHIGPARAHFVRAEPLLVDPLVLARVLENTQPLRELRQKRVVPLADGVAVLAGVEGLGADHKVGPAVFPHGVERPEASGQPAFVAAFGHVPHHVLLRLHGGDAGPDSACLQGVQDGVFLQDHQIAPLEFLEGGGGLAVPPAHHADAMDHLIARREVQNLVALGRVEHALDRVDVPGAESRDGLRPGAEADLDIHAHPGRDGPRDLHREPLRTPLLVEELEGGVAVVAPDHDGAVGGQLQAGEPLGVEPAVGAVGHHQREALVEQGQRVAVALPNREAEVLPELLDRLVDDAETPQARLRQQPEGHQALDDDGLAAPPRRGFGRRPRRWG